MSSRIIEVNNHKFTLHGGGFVGDAAVDFDAIVDSVTDKLVEIGDLDTLSDDDLISIGNRACWMITREWHDPNAAHVDLVRS